MDFVLSGKHMSAKHNTANLKHSIFFQTLFKRNRLFRTITTYIVSVYI